MNRLELTTRVFREIAVIQERTDFLLKRGLPASVPPAQFKLLNHLIYTTNVDETPSQLAQNSHVSLSAMSQIIKQLLGKGYVTLEVGKADARKKFVRTTQEGLAAHRDALSQIDGDFRPLANKFSAHDLGELYGLLQSFRLTFEKVTRAGDRTTS